MKSKGKDFELFSTVLTSNAIQLLEDPRQLPKHGTLGDISGELQMLFADININLYRHYPDTSITPGILQAKDRAFTDTFTALANTLYKEEKDTKKAKHFKLRKPSHIEDEELAFALASSMANLLRMHPLPVGNSETIFAFAQIIAGSVGRHLGFDRMQPAELSEFMGHLEQCAVAPSYRPIPEDRLKKLSGSILRAISRSKDLRAANFSSDTQLDQTRPALADHLWKADSSHLWDKDPGLLKDSVASATAGKVDCLVTIDGQCVPAEFIKDWAKWHEKHEREFRLKAHHLDSIRAQYGIELTIPVAERIDGISLKNGVPLLKLDEDLLTGIPLKKLHELEETARSHSWIEHLEDPVKLLDFTKMIEKTSHHDLEKRYGISKKDKEWLELAGKRLKNGMITKINEYTEASLINDVNGQIVTASHVADSKALVISGAESKNDGGLIQELASKHFGHQGFVLVSDAKNLSHMGMVSVASQHGYKPDPTASNPYPFAEKMVRAIRNKQLKFLRESQCYNVCAESNLTPDRSSTEDFLVTLKKTGADIDVISLLKPIEDIAQSSNGSMSNPLRFLLLSSRASRNQFMGMSALQMREDTPLHHDGFIPRGSYVVDNHIGLVRDSDQTYKAVTIVGETDGKHAMPSSTPILNTLNHISAMQMPADPIILPVRSATQGQPGRSMIIYDVERFRSYIAHGTKINPGANNAAELFIDTEAEGLLNVAIAGKSIEDTLKRLRAEQHVNMGNKLISSSVEGLDALKSAINDPDGLGKEFIRAVEMIRNANGRVLITGVGKSLRVGELVAATFMSLGIPCDIIDPTHAVHGDLGKIDPRAGDVLIAISKSGNSQELQPVVNEARERGLKIISVTHREHSFLGKNAKEAGCNGVLLHIPDSAEPSPFVSTEGDQKVSPPTVSTSQVKVLLESIALSVAHSKGMGVGDFGKHHPAGALGKASGAKALGG